MLSVKIDFDKCIPYRVNNGQHIHFWTDIWCSEISLKSQFSMVSMVDRDQDAFISDYYQSLGGRIVWGFRFHRNFWDDELNEYIQLLAHLEFVSISMDKEDERWWSQRWFSLFGVYMRYCLA